MKRSEHGRGPDRGAEDLVGADTLSLATTATDKNSPDPDLPDTEATDKNSPDPDLPDTNATDKNPPDPDLPDTDATDKNSPDPHLPDTNATDKNSPDPDLPDTDATDRDSPDPDLPDTDATDRDSPDRDFPDRDISGTVAPDMALQDLRVVVERIEGRSVCGLTVGDFFEVTRSSQVRIPTGGHFCLYALAAVLPLLPAKQRPLPAGDWLERDSLVACPDPDERLVMRIERLGLCPLNSRELT